MFMKEIYLASRDPVILKEHDRVFLLNEDIIDTYNRLPFYRKWFENPEKIVRENWRKFELFQERRIR